MILYITNMADPQEIARINRLRKKAIMRCDICLKRVKAMHAIALQCEGNIGLISQLEILLEDVDEIWTEFTAENETLINCLIDLDMEAEYSESQVIEMREFISFSKAIARKFHDYPRSVLSCHGGSHISLNEHDVANNGEHEEHPNRNSFATPNVNVEQNKNEMSSPSNNSVPNSNISVKPARLPEIPLPIFHGDIFKWLSFRDRFLSMVDQRPNLTDIEKFYYLAGCLKDEALDTIRGIPVSADNYRLAWSSLTSRFDRPRLVASSLLETLLTAQRSSNETLIDLNKFLLIFDEGIAVLESMKIPNLGDFILFTLASRCLPSYSVKLFESQLSSGFPTVKDLLTFVKARINVLECVPRDHAQRSIKPPVRSSSVSTGFKSNFNNPKRSQQTSLIAHTNSKSTGNCIVCSGSHAVVSCKKFSSWSADIRHKWVRNNKVCFRCLRSGHWAHDCRSPVQCDKCPRKHHPLVHVDEHVNTGNNEQTASTSRQNHDSSDPRSSLVGQTYPISHSVILGTALVHIRDRSGVLHTVRALVDSASQISAITTTCASRLGLRVTKWTAPVSGLSGATVPNVKGLVTCHVQPRFSEEPVFKFDAWVFPLITTQMPGQPIPENIANKYRNLAMADPLFAVPEEIDVLLGADLFARMLDGKRVSVGDSFPVAFSSVFGWILIGPVPNENGPQAAHIATLGSISLLSSVENLMEKFWRVEEPEPAPEEFTHAGRCEQMFRNQCIRDESGRFIVPLLFSQLVDEHTFDGSRAIALKRFDALEKKLSVNSRLRNMYNDFMAEYLSMGHMSPAKSHGSYFIPHHAVFKANDIEEKLRVVFDASARTYSGNSLNQCLFSGPKLQRDVIDVLVLFRLSRYAFTADISKMYRQILVVPEHRRYQHILWRESPHDELKTYELNTVTYGVSCAPFLAIRVLHFIAEHDCHEFPAVRDALKYCTYVDDICIGSDTIEAATTLQSNLCSVLHRAGMQLKKWASNTEAILNSVPLEDRATKSLTFDDSDGVGIKVLGLHWEHTDDTFHYVLQSIGSIMTKRGMLSLIARIFDPLGFLAPVIFYAKHLMQRVWILGISWDEQLPTELVNLWHQFVTDLSVLQTINIPRFIGTRVGIKCYLCGFCDASERGYAAVVYLRTIDNIGLPNVSLLGAKTKMAPTKASTVPRLELCAAVLLARWMARLKKTLSLKVQVIDTFAWSDSTTVLNWLKVPHENFKVFVSNRIHKIKTLLPNYWGYIASSKNPADCISRGLLPTELVNHKLYWHGPDILRLPLEEWQTEAPGIPVDQLPECQTVTPSVLVTELTDPLEHEWFTRFSSFVQMIRIVARMYRFINKCRRRPVINTFLSRDDLDHATLVIVKCSQRIMFKTLFNALLHHHPINAKPIACLRPFINAHGIICVGGRLGNAKLPDDQKHPILLSKSSHLSVLLVRHWHDLTGHGGPRILSSIIRRTYWILSINTLIRTVISKCTRCVRLASVNPQPVMADLPASRVTECFPFSRVGIDFAGPLPMTEQRLRKSRQYKVYIAVFVCFTVKAVHLEYVSDLSTDALLAALHRFVARRGCPTDIYTDCGTNFVGASNQLRALVNDPDCKERLIANVTSSWHFNPPAAPHFGGLWEAAVRSAKRVMVRIMGNHKFTLEEFCTILCRVEAILNSRPLVPLSTDPTEYDCLTPGHFLIGRPLVSIPEKDIPVTTRPLVQRWKLLNQSVQAFWRRWRDEYLNTLQTRNRWHTDAHNILVGDMVVLKDPHTSPLQWPIARVIEVFPSADSVVRVVRVQTSTGSFTRPVVKVVKLPA